MKIRVFQKGFNYSQDGHGNRLVMHLQGCNMRCPWCSNPEGFRPDGTVMVYRNWLTDASCPKGAVKNKEPNRQQCASCEDRACTKIRQKGIRLSCEETDTEELLDECIRSAPMYFDGGGVTLSGGEVACQLPAVKQLLSGLRKAGIHTAIETNGSIPDVTGLIPYTSQWIMDVKHWDAEKQERTTGVSNRNTLRVLQTVCEQHKDVLVRIPLIPGFNDGEEDVKELPRLLSRYVRGTSAKVEYLLYHEYGKEKWEQCGLTYPMGEERLRPGIRELFEEATTELGMTCIRT